MFSRKLLTPCSLYSRPFAGIPHLARPSSSLQALRSSIPHPPPSKDIIPIAQPVVLALSEPLKRKESDPPAKDHVVVLDPTVFAHPTRTDILHLCTIHYLDSLRQGSASTKTRAEVHGSGIKLRRQKGTGKARIGDGQSPILVGGGRAFGPKPRDFSTKLPRKVIQMGMRVALSVKVKENRLGVMSSIDWPNGRTKHLKERIERLGLRKTLFITGEEAVPVGLERAIANIQQVELVRADAVNVYEIMKHQRLILDVKAVDYFEDSLKKDVPISPLPLAEATSVSL
ncbi:ribosomal protein L4 domain-containing protein [Cyathus striatus]|nr:ribosomal protein L4 domain-containing protein [Cyathus striatus]